MTTQMGPGLEVTDKEIDAGNCSFESLVLTARTTRPVMAAEALPGLPRLSELPGEWHLANGAPLLSHMPGQAITHHKEHKTARQLAAREHLLSWH